MGRLDSRIAFKSSGSPLQSGVSTIQAITKNFFTRNLAILQTRFLGQSTVSRVQAESVSTRTLNL